MIRPHTLGKFDRQRGYCGIVNKGMANLWPNNRGYLELFAGSGLALLDDKEFDGCPLIAALCEPGFTRLAFVEFNPNLYMALE